ncbi:mitochondrial 2-enoyl thioester reductase [Saitoella coloradoensis]
MFKRQAIRSIRQATSSVKPAVYSNASASLFFRRFASINARAVVYSEHGKPTEVLKVHSYKIDTPKADEINVRFLAAPINPSDINQVEGVYPSKPEKTTALSTAEPSAVGGNEGLVEILETGSNIKGFQKGDWAIMRRVNFGTWRTHATVPEDQLLPVPKGMRVTAAATVAVNPSTAYRMLKDFANLEKGDFFIQNGGNSGVGQAAVQIAKQWGLKSISIVRDRPNLDDLKSYLKELGADYVITEDELMNKEIREKVKQWTGGKPIKLALNCVGGKPSTKMAALLGNGGHIVTYGAMARQPLSLPASLLIFKDIKAHGFWMTRFYNGHDKERQDMLDEIFGWVKEGKFKEAMNEVTTWKTSASDEELWEAFKGAMEKSQAGFGKKQIIVMEE